MQIWREFGAESEKIHGKRGERDTKISYLSSQSYQCDSNREYKKQDVKKNKYVERN